MDRRLGAIEEHETISGTRSPVQPCALMPTTPEPNESVPSPNAEPARPQREPPKLVLHPITGPPTPDMTDRIAESLRRHEAELATAQRLVEQARAGSAPESPARAEESSTPPAPGRHRIEFDWRGETAYYHEHDRRVTLTCVYWGGPKGSVSHIHGVWEYADGRRVRLTIDERANVLHAIVAAAKEREDITLAIDYGHI
jgi:hypothetical protein